MKRLWKRREGTAEEEKNKPMPLFFFSFYFLSGWLTAGEAEGLERERQRRRWRRRGRRRREGGTEISHNRKLRHTHSHTHSVFVCFWESAWTGKEGREGEWRGGWESRPPPLLLSLSFSPLLLSSPPPSLSLWSRRVAASDSAWRNHERCHHR